MDDRDAIPSLAEFNSAILDALPFHIAVIDAQGTVVRVNSAWRDFGAANGMQDDTYGVGTNYFKVCRAAVDPVARAATEGIQDVLRGTRQTFYLEYPCHSPDEERWFAMRVSSPAEFAGFAVLSHENITDRVVAEAGLQAKIVGLESRSDRAATPPLGGAATAPVILIVDDDTGLLRALARVFTVKGALVRSFEDPPEAVAWATAAKPDFILTDYHMPDMNGAELIRRVRQASGSEIPAFIMSGEHSAEVIEGAESLGCELISKPLDSAAVFSTILDAIAIDE